MPNVSKITQKLIEIVQINSDLKDVWVQGEISNVFSRNSNTYFTLKDNVKRIECVIFKDWAPLQKDLPAVGSSISVNGQIYVYGAKSEYRFMVKKINPPENFLPVQPASVSILITTWENILKTHSGEVQGEISEVFVTPADFTIFKLKDVTVGGPSENIIECALPPKVNPPFPLEIGERVHVKGRFGIFPDASAYRIEIGNANNIAQAIKRPRPASPKSNQCLECRQHFDNLQDQLCHICYYARLTYEGIVVGAVQRYFDDSKFSNFSTEREHKIRWGAYREGRADIALLNSEGDPVAIAECKRIGYDGSDGIVQLKSYINPTVAKLGLFADNTDPYEWTFFKKNDERQRFDQITRSQFERELGVEPVQEISSIQIGAPENYKDELHEEIRRKLDQLFEEKMQRLEKPLSDLKIELQKRGIVNWFKNLFSKENK